jgi:hypothetical protein
LREAIQALRGDDQLSNSDYVASIADIKYLKDMPEEFLPYVSVKATIEGREIKNDERIAILNISSTTSYVAIFLDKGKKIEEVEKEVRESSAVLNADSRQILKDILERES